MKLINLVEKLGFFVFPLAKSGERITSFLFLGLNAPAPGLLVWLGERQKICLKNKNKN